MSIQPEKLSIVVIAGEILIEVSGGVCLCKNSMIIQCTGESLSYGLLLDCEARYGALATAGGAG